MKNACFWSIVALLAIVLCLATAQSIIKVQYKVNEVGSRGGVATYCGDQIRHVYEQLCSRNRKRRSALMDEQEALSFLLYRSPRSASDGSAGGSGTDIVEECCAEGCASEEVLEYC